MANKRNRQKQRNSSKTLEGYERYLLKQKKKWQDAYSVAERPHERQLSSSNVNYYKRTHEELREYYLDI